jgi:hypothetical protein
VLEHERRAKQVEETDRVALWDKSMLDAVSGQLDVDVEVELAVPVIGSRRAVHKVRVPIEGGSIDFIALEKCLAPLEDALLNFAAREDKLALEIGIPLIGSRGHGKPILLWDLNEHDRALAEQDRVRLAVLPNAHGVSKETEAPNQSAASKPSDAAEKGSKFALRSLGFQNLRTDLSIAQHREPLEAVLTDLAIGKLEAAGDVFYDAEGGARPGQLRGAARAVAASTRNMPLGSSVLGVEVALEQLAEVVADFEGQRLQQVRAGMKGLEIRALSLEPGPESS